MSEPELTAQEQAAARMCGMTDEEYAQYRHLHPEPRQVARQTPAERARERAEEAETERVRGLVREVLAERERA